MASSTGGFKTKSAAVFAATKEDMLRTAMCLEVTERKKRNNSLSLHNDSGETYKRLVESFVEICGRTS